MAKVQLEMSEDEFALWSMGDRIDEIKKQLKALTEERTQLIKKLFEEGHSQAHIARLACVTKGRVSQIVTGYYDK